MSGVGRWSWMPWAGRGRGAAALAVLAAVVLGSGLAGCGSGTAEEATDAGDAPAPSVTAPPTSGPVPAPTTAPTPTTVACPAGGGRVTAGVVDAAMGLRAMGIVLTNCGTQPITISGYPGLALLDEGHRPFAVEVLHGAGTITSNEGFCTPTGRFDAGPQPVTLEPGGQATAGLVWRNTTTTEFDRLVDAPYLSVAPTEADAAQVVAVDGGVDLGTTGRLGVSAWAPLPTSCP